MVMASQQYSHAHKSLHCCYLERTLRGSVGEEVGLVDQSHCCGSPKRLLVSLALGVHRKTWWCEGKHSCPGRGGTYMGQFNMETGVATCSHTHTHTHMGCILVPRGAYGAAV